MEPVPGPSSHSVRAGAEKGWVWAECLVISGGFGVPNASIIQLFPFKKRKHKHTYAINLGRGRENQGERYIKKKNSD